MNHVTISCIFIVICNMTCGFFVLISRPRTHAKKLWSLFCFIVSLWALGYVYGSSTQNYDEALLWFRMAKHAALFIPMFFFHFILGLTNKEKIKHNILFLYYFLKITYFIFCVINPEYFINKVTLRPSGNYYPFAGKYFLLAPIMFFFIIFHALIILADSYRTASTTKRNQYKYLFTGVLIGTLGGGTSFLPIFDINIPPYGNYLTSMYVFSVSYAIIKHHLMDIRIIFKKSIIYSMLITCITIIYLVTTVALEKTLQNIFEYNSPILSLVVVIFIGLFSIPLRNRIQSFVDRTLFKGTNTEIAEENRLLRRKITQSEKYKTLTTLATGIAHEVKNPLTAIKTFSEYLPDKLEDKQFLLKFANIVGREVDRINDMTHQLLDYGKPAPLAIKKTSIHKLINSTVDILNSKFVNQKIQVIKNLDDQQELELELDIDPNQLRQALLNIILNAIDAMPSKGTLTISSFSTNTSYYIIQIEDTGKGIPREDLSRVFDPFFSKKDDGTGLGLSITQSIIENHKGIIQIKSKVGMGTTVRIDLPLN